MASWAVKRAIPIVDGNRECRSCQVVKPVAEFPKHRKCHQGLSARCFLCTRRDNKLWRDANPDKQRYRGSWQQRNPEWRRQNLSTKYRSLKTQVFHAYGGKCKLCGFADDRALHIDHVLENGADDRRKRTPLQRLSAIVQDGFPADYQLLCANCNTIKSCEAGTLRYTQVREEAV